MSYVKTDRRRNAGIRENGEDPIAVTFEVSIPLWRSRYAAAVREAQSGVIAADKTRAGILNDLVARVDEAFYYYEDANRRLRLFRDSLAAKAGQAFETALTAFTSGKGNYVELLDAGRTALEFQLEVERALTERAVRLAELEKLAGRALSKSPLQPGAEKKKED